MPTLALTDAVNGQVADASLINNNNAAIKNVVNGGLDNTNVAAGAAIPYSKLNLVLGIVNADISTSAAIAPTKLADAPKARAYHNVAQTIPTAAVSALAFNSERFDTDTIHDTVTNNSRLTCKTAGAYDIVANVEMAANSAGSYRSVSIRLNGTNYLAFVQIAPTSAGNIILHVSTQYVLAVNDYVECMVAQDSGGNLNIQSNAYYSPEFSMARLP